MNLWFVLLWKEGTAPKVGRTVSPQITCEIDSMTMSAPVAE